MGLVEFQFRSYRRLFYPPLRTSHGSWDVRNGIFLRLQDEYDRVGFGEIAPLEWFGSESFDDAIAFCRSLPKMIDSAFVSAISDRLPACQFGFETALMNLQGTVIDTPLPHSGLLPAGEAALMAWRSLFDAGYRTFKWKIGVQPIAIELDLFQPLIEALPTPAKLRLDANAGLTIDQAHQWLTVCDQHPSIEFLEQPLAVDQFAPMLTLSQQYQTPIALDESIATFEQLRDGYDQGWRGVFVIKPAIAGFPSRVRQFCQDHAIDAVFSSVFETAIARQAGLTLAAELSDRAVGYGTNHWFKDLLTEDFEELWNSL